MFLTYTDVKNPSWANSDHTMINCEVNFSHVSEEYVLFTASESDVTEHGPKIYEECLNKKYGEISEYIAPPPVSQENIIAGAREVRNQFLKKSDWTQLPDVPENTRNAWAAYRQELRDVPQQANFPETIIWPAAPKL
jgi:hypothetical protein